MIKFMNVLKRKSGQGTIETIMIIALMAGIALFAYNRLKPASETKIKSIEGQLLQP